MTASCGYTMPMYVYTFLYKAFVVSYSSQRGPLLFSDLFFTKKIRQSDLIKNTCYILYISVIQGLYLESI